MTPKITQPTFTITQRRKGYTVYHTGSLFHNNTVSLTQRNLPVGRIYYDVLQREYKFKPSIWVVPILTVQTTKELQTILQQLNDGRHL